MKVLEVSNIKKYFGTNLVLDDVSFGVDAGECLGIVGRSGCGKSTTVKIVARLLNADGGRIVLCGRDITTATDFRNIYADMQMIFQMPEDSFDPRKTLGWSIGEPLRNHGFENVGGRVRELLIEVGLPGNYSERYPHEVSGGECQRAAIARAISLSPKLLICDEATSALDVTVQAQVIALIRRLCREKNIACLFITHDLALLPKIADRVIVMYGGRIVEEFNGDDVPRSTFAKELLSADLFNLETSY